MMIARKVAGHSLGASLTATAHTWMLVCDCRSSLARRVDSRDGDCVGRHHHSAVLGHADVAIAGFNRAEERSRRCGRRVAWAGLGSGSMVAVNIVNSKYVRSDLRESHHAGEEGKSEHLEHLGAIRAGLLGCTEVVDLSGVSIQGCCVQLRSESTPRKLKKTSGQTNRSVKLYEIS